MSDKISAQHILVEHEYEIKDLQRKLDEGTTFEDLAKDFSQCPSGKDGGHLGEFGKGMMVAAFEKAAFALAVDQVSEPVKTQFGYHLIKRLS